MSPIPAERLAPSATAIIGVVGWRNCDWKAPNPTINAPVDATSAGTTCLSASPASMMEMIAGTHQIASNGRNSSQAG